MYIVSSSRISHARVNAARINMAQAPPMEAATVMSPSIEEWCKSVWPELPLRQRTVLQVAISRMEKGYELVIPISYPTEWTGMPANTELVYHGANPMALHRMLPNNLLPSEGKEGYVGVWTSRADFTAYGYPMSLKGGVPITEDGPWIRVLLEISIPQDAIIKAWRGKKRKDGKWANSQVCTKPDRIKIEKVRLICTRSKLNPDVDGTQAGLNRKRKYEKYVATAETLYRKCSLEVSLRRRLWGRKARLLRPPVTPGMRPSAIP
jgi:hypothetical protein